MNWKIPLEYSGEISEAIVAMEEKETGETCSLEAF
jgi:hypothetical protein